MESLELQFQWIMAIVANINQIEESTNQSVATILCFADFFLVLFLLSFVLYGLLVNGITIQGMECIHIISNTANNIYFMLLIRFQLVYVQHIPF